MPFYQFTVPNNSPSATLKREIAAAITEAHVAVTDAPASFVNVSFVEVPPGSLFVSGEEVTQGRMVGVIRSGRTVETKKQLILSLAEAWSRATGEPVRGFAVFITEEPGSSMLEAGEFLPEASGNG